MVRERLSLRLINHAAIDVTYNMVLFGLIIGEDSSLKEINPRGYELLYAMKNICHNKKPEVS